MTDDEAPSLTLGPLALRYVGRSWRATFDDVSWLMFGDPHGPDPASAAFLTRLVDGRVSRAIAAFVAALPPSTFVPLQAPLKGGFAAERCGFGGPLFGMAVIVRGPTDAFAHFYTGEPDGYATYEVALDAAGHPVSVSAYCS